MGLYRRYVFIKGLLAVLFFANAILFSSAIVIGFKHYKNQQAAKESINQVLALASEVREVDFEASVREKLAPAFNQVEVSVAQLLLIAFLTLIFGVVAPILVFYRLSIVLAKLRAEAEKKFVKWMNWWIKTYGKEKFDPKNPFYQKPQFWVNVFLVFIETMAPQSRNPMVGFFGELAPVLRAELSKDEFGDEGGEDS